MAAHAKIQLQINISVPARKASLEPIVRLSTTPAPQALAKMVDLVRSLVQTVNFLVPAHPDGRGRPVIQVSV